jgi:ribosomal protein S27E
VFTFWAKSAVDIELRTIRLKSSTYTTNAILDTITAACVQLSEMVGKDGPGKTSTSTSTVVTSAGVQQRKGSIVDWVSIRARAVTQEEKQHWVPDEAATKCRNCNTVFSAFNRRHHCRNCGDVFCDSCTRGRTTLTAEPDAEVVRVCDRCLAEVTQRLTNAKDMSNKVPVLRTHEDLAKTLQARNFLYPFRLGLMKMPPLWCFSLQFSRILRRSNQAVDMKISYLGLCSSCEKNNHSKHCLTIVNVNFV